jgi:GyrI-like small molecule binding protein
LTAKARRVEEGFELQLNRPEFLFNSRRQVPDEFEESQCHAHNAGLQVGFLSRLHHSSGRFQHFDSKETHGVDVQIVHFPETKIAALEHRAPPHLEYETVRRLIEWRLANRLHPDRHRSYGVHYNDPRTTPPADYRADFGVSVEHEMITDVYLPLR